MILGYEYIVGESDYDIVSNEIFVNIWSFRIKQYLRRTEKYTLERVNYAFCVNANIEVLNKYSKKEEKINFVDNNLNEFFKVKNRHSTLVHMDEDEVEEICTLNDLSIPNIKNKISVYSMTESFSDDNPLFVRVYNGYNNSSLKVLEIK